MRSEESRGADKKPVATQHHRGRCRSRCASAPSSPRCQLREIPWPEESVPAGAFAKISDLTSNGKRVVLAPIEANEPMLRQQDHRLRPARDACRPCCRTA